MAYKQNPGRGNNSKTGHGLPSPFKQEKTPKGNKEGYNPTTSPVPNTVNKGKYEKTLDKVGNMLILRGGDKKEISRAQIGTKQEENLRKSHEAKKTDTESRRKANLDFLESRQKTGQAVGKK